MSELRSFSLTPFFTVVHLNCSPECSNSAISLQQTEHPHMHSHGHTGLGPPQISFMDIRRRGWDYQHEKDRALGFRQREWEPECEERESDSPMDFDDGGMSHGQGHPSFPPGWGGAPEKEFKEEGFHFGSRFVLSLNLIQ